MIRRDFVRALTRTAAGLLVAPDALELVLEPVLEPRRRYWPGADFGEPMVTNEEHFKRLIGEALDEMMENWRRQMVNLALWNPGPMLVAYEQAESITIAPTFATDPP